MGWSVWVAASVRRPRNESGHERVAIKRVAHRTPGHRKPNTSFLNNSVQCESSIQRIATGTQQSQNCFGRSAFSLCVCKTVREKPTAFQSVFFNIKITE